MVDFGSFDNSGTLPIDAGSTSTGGTQGSSTTGNKYFGSINSNSDYNKYALIGVVVLGIWFLIKKKL